jgi:hypothetical protein
MTCTHTHNHKADVDIACMEDRANGFMAVIRITCADCGKAFQFLGLEPGVDTHGARVSIDGLEANIAICPEGVQPSPLQRMTFNINRFDG